MIKIKSKKETKYYKKGEEGWLGIGGFCPEEHKVNAYHCNTQFQAKYNANQAKVYNKEDFEVLGIVPVLFL